MTDERVAGDEPDDTAPERPIDIAKQHKTPKDAFEANGLPVFEVKGVAVEPPRAFRYRDTVFPRVELVAKRFYEDLGCIASWNEGTAFKFIRDAVSLYFCAGLSHCYRYNRNIETDPRTSNAKAWNRSDDLHLDNADVLRFESPLSAQMYFDLAGDALPPAPEARKEYFKEIIKPAPLFDRIVSKGELSKAYTALRSALTAQTGPLLLPFVTMAQQHFVARGQDKYGSSPYFLEFANQVLEQGGFKPAYNELEVFDVPGHNFDLMVFDPTTKEVRFSEVKNRDKLTHGQLVSLFKHLKDPVLPIELCIVQPS
ncbi:hypothetical protein [Hydrogenophaga sp.]|uniref:hypothetical protein n=1 Tax=Hydrogenophaga sp. TaxID=1904254 RepID=UPI00261DD214|nr:hypothetical protein [Hydrogenophaga sp.]